MIYYVIQQPGSAPVFGEAPVPPTDETCPWRALVNHVTSKHKIYISQIQQWSIDKDADLQCWFAAILIYSGAKVQS